MQPLLPRFNLRWMLAFMGLGAVVFLFFSSALKGRPFAGAVGAGTLAVLAVMFVHIMLFFGVWLFAQLLGLLPTSLTTPKSPTAGKLPAPSAAVPAAPTVASRNGDAP